MKINLKVQAEFDIDGSIRPTSIVWEDGRVFAIDRVLDIRRAASLKAGGMGMRYTCRICGKVVNLFNDETEGVLFGTVAHSHCCIIRRTLSYIHHNVVIVISEITHYGRIFPGCYIN